MQQQQVVGSNRPSPGVGPQGADNANFKHPWMVPQSATKTKVYNFLHKVCAYATLPPER